MRVLLIANTLPPADISGVGEQVLQLAAGLRARGHEVEVLGRGPRGARGPKSLFPLTVVPPTLRRLRQFRPHVVQVHESDGGFAAAAVAILARALTPTPRLVALLQVSYVEELRAVRPLCWGDEVLGKPGRVERRFRWIKAPLQIALGCLSAFLADLVLAPSRRTAGELEHDYSVTGVEVLPNVTGGLAIGGTVEVPPTLGDVDLLFVGRLRLRKGLEVLLHALARLSSRGVVPRLLVVGDGEHRAALEGTMHRLGLEGQVTFAGKRSAAEVHALLARCRALVVPSIYEGMPLVVLEAMSAGRPVVASAVSGIPEVVLDGATGWLVPPEDPGRLAAALAELWGNESEGRRRGAAGKQRVDAEFTPAKAAETWEALLGIRRTAEEN